jgi:hypothetical protein
VSGPSIVALVTLAVGLPLNLYVTVKLWRLSRAAPWSKVLRHSAIGATSVLLLVVVFGIIFLNNDLPSPILTGDETRYITRFVVLVVSVVPALYWLRLYRRPRP